jgi:hypothetical protein
MSEEAFAPADARQLLEVAELTNIHTFEIRGQRLEVTADDPEQGITPDVGIRVAPTSLETRMRVAVRLDGAEVTADMAVEYTFARPCALSAEVAREFVERVAVMAIYPFVRESIFATASRLGVDAPVLGLIRSGSFQVGPLVATAGPTPDSLASELDVTPDSVRAWLAAQGGEPAPDGSWQLSEDAAAAVRDHFIEVATASSSS